MPLPLTVSCFSKIQIGFTFLVQAYPGSLGKRPLNVCVCVCACVRACVRACVHACARARVCVCDVAVRFIALQLHAKAVLNNGDVLAKVTCFASVVI